MLLAVPLRCSAVEVTGRAKLTSHEPSRPTTPLVCAIQRKRSPASTRLGRLTLAAGRVASAPGLYGATLGARGLVALFGHGGRNGCRKCVKRLFWWANCRTHRSSLVTIFTGAVVRMTQYGSQPGPPQTRSSFAPRPLYELLLAVGEERPNAAGNRSRVASARSRRPCECAVRPIYRVVCRQR